MQTMIEQRVATLQEALETDLKDKLRQIMTAVESLNARITQMEHEICDEKELRKKVGEVFFVLVEVKLIILRKSRTPIRC